MPFIDLGSRSVISNIFKLFVSLETAKPIETKFHMEPGIVEWKFVQMVLVAWPRWLPCPYMIKTLKTFFSRTNRLMTLKFGMQHRVLEYYQICSNDDPGLTLTFYGKIKFGPLCFCMGKG